MTKTTARITALASHKGGVAKTTTAVNLAAELTSHGTGPILLIDLDGQASTTLSLGFDPSQLRSTIYDVLLSEPAILTSRAIIRETPVPNLHLLPSSPEMVVADVFLAERTARTDLISRALLPTRETYDHIIIDCPSALGLVTLSALNAADGYLMPVEPHYLALEGVQSLLQAMSTVSRFPGVTGLAKLDGIVITRADYRTRACRESIRALREVLGRQVYTTEIRTNIRLAEAPARGVPICRYDAQASGARAYRALAQEFVANLETEMEAAP